MSESTQHITTRREIMKSLPVAAAILALHEAIGQNHPVPAATAPATTQPDGNKSQAARSPAAQTVAGPGTKTASDPLIRSLRLLTARPLQEMRRFYGDKLGLPISDDSRDAFTISTGGSQLTFARALKSDIASDAGRGDGAPMYHFAFNIPPEKIRAACNWQEQRTPLIPPRPGLSDPSYPSSVWHFREWNAHSVFFFDPAFNIVEYIARHDLPRQELQAESAPPSVFSPVDLLCASEIGLVFDAADGVAAAVRIQRELGLQGYPRGATDPWAMGDERGLLLCLRRFGELWGDHTPTPVRWGVFRTDVEIAARNAAKPVASGDPILLKFTGRPYAIRANCDRFAGSAKNGDG